MSNRCPIIQTDSPPAPYRVIDHRRDAGPALLPATLPSISPARASSAGLALRYLVGSLSAPLTAWTPGPGTCT